MTKRIVGCGVVLLIALAAVATFDARRYAGAFIALMGLASLAYVASLWIIARMPAPPGRRLLAACLLLGVAWRLVLLGAAPIVSDDVFRYVWDGSSSTGSTRTTPRRPIPPWRRSTLT